MAALKKRRGRAPLGPARTVRFYWLKLVRLQGSPFTLARGVGIGIFVGLTPTIPFHSILTVLFSTLLRGNIVAAFVASWFVSNPLTIPLQYYLAWRIGSLFVPHPVTWHEVSSMLHHLHEMGILEAARYLFIECYRIMAMLMAGGLVLALPLAAAGYFCALYLYYRRQKMKQERFLARYGGRIQERREDRKGP